jgi:hypothetical protein
MKNSVFNKEEQHKPNFLFFKERLVVFVVISPLTYSKSWNFRLRETIQSANELKCKKSFFTVDMSHNPVELIKKNRNSVQDLKNNNLCPDNENLL